MLNAIHHLRQLQRLIFTFDDEWDPTQMQRFLEGLGNGCPRLMYLEIGCTNAPSSKAMDDLKRLEHLEELLFSIVDTAGDDGFWHAIENLSQLKSIRVYCGDVINMDDLRHLKQQRPDLKIIADTTFYSG